MTGEDESKHDQGDLRKALRQWAVSAHRMVILMGWSRGAAWALRVAVLEAKLLDGTWAFAAYQAQYHWDTQGPPLVIAYGTPERF